MLTRTVATSHENHLELCGGGAGVPIFAFIKQESATQPTPIADGAALVYILNICT